MRDLKRIPFTKSIDGSQLIGYVAVKNNQSPSRTYRSYTDIAAFQT